jgi:hypothetical protein
MGVRHLYGDGTCFLDFNFEKKNYFSDLMNPNQSSDPLSCSVRLDHFFKNKIKEEECPRSFSLNATALSMFS